MRLPACILGFLLVGPLLATPDENPQLYIRGNLVRFATGAASGFSVQVPLTYVRYGPGFADLFPEAEILRKQLADQESPADRPWLLYARPGAILLVSWLDTEAPAADTWLPSAPAQFEGEQFLDLSLGSQRLLVQGFAPAGQLPALEADLNAVRASAYRFCAP